MRSDKGKVTLPVLLLALLGGLGAYSAVKYGPVWMDFQRVKALVGEAGQRSIEVGRDEAGQAWLDERAAVEGFAWLEASELLWERIDREHLDVGIRYEVDIDHVAVGSHRLVLSYYCTATLSGCEPFSPRW